ncbi:hypothetical protein Tco_0518664, partial [Tanacetum coccineum]
MFDGSTYCEDDDSAALVDGGANGFSNTSPSDIALGTLSVSVLDWSYTCLSCCCSCCCCGSSTSGEVFGISAACGDEFVGVGAVSAVVVDFV